MEIKKNDVWYLNKKHLDIEETITALLNQRNSLFLELQNYKPSGLEYTETFDKYEKVLHDLTYEEGKSAGLALALYVLNIVMKPDEI